MQWFRLHSNTLNNPKAQKLSGDMFKFWINILCVASENDGVLPSLDDVTFALRMPSHAVTEALQILVTSDLLTVTKNQYGETYAPKDWSEWQYKSNTSADRMRRHREKKKASHENVTVTPPETETEQIQKNADDARASPQSDIFKIGERIAEITGWADDPNWTGNYSRLKVWIETGHDFDLDILPTIRAIMLKRKGQGPPGNLKYFEKAIADAKATRLQPMPKGKAHERPDSQHSSVDALFAGFAAAPG